jgi:hypothetical protein
MNEQAGGQKAPEPGIEGEYVKYVAHIGFEPKEILVRYEWGSKGSKIMAI